MKIKKLNSILLGGVMSLCLAIPTQSVALSSYSSTYVPVKDTADPLYHSEIQQLAKSSEIRKALQFIEANDDQTIANQIKFTEILAPPFKEDLHGKNEFFAGLLRKNGADSVWIDSIGNVMGLRKGTKRGKVLGLAAHLDVVFPEGTDVKVRQKGDTLFAPGISDDNRGLAAILTVLQSLEKFNIRTTHDILFIGDVGEEGLGDLRGMKYLFRKEGPQIDHFISIDGSGRRNVTNGALGSHRYKVTFKGPGGHSWGAFGMANPHHALGEAISNFVKGADKYTQKGVKTSYNVGKIGGGTSVNSIPFESWMEVDMRSLSPKHLTEIDTIFQRAIRKALDTQNEIRRRGKPLTVDIKMIGDRPSGETNKKNPLVQRAIASTVFFGKKARLRTSSTDSNIPISLGIPAITLGGGGISRGAHSPQEYFINRKGYKGIQRILLLTIAQANGE